MTVNAFHFLDYLHNGAYHHLRLLAPFPLSGFSFLPLGLLFGAPPRFCSPPRNWVPTDFLGVIGNGFYLLYPLWLFPPHFSQPSLPFLVRSFRKEGRFFLALKTGLAISLGGLVRFLPFFHATLFSTLTPDPGVPSHDGDPPGLPASEKTNYTLPHSR